MAEPWEKHISHIPRGGIEVGESPFQAMIRETREERVSQELDDYEAREEYQLRMVEMVERNLAILRENSRGLGNLQSYHDAFCQVLFLIY